MNRVIATVVLLLLLASGCSQPPEVRKLSGVWGIESAEQLAQRLGQAAGQDLLQPEAEEDREDRKPQMKIEFRRNGRLTTYTELGAISPPPKQGRWKLVSSAEEGKEILIECDLAGQTTEHLIRFIDPDTIELVPPNMAGTRQKLRFVRL
jgi:hypothetical protein